MTMGAGEVPGADVIFYVNGGPPGMSRGIYDEFFWPYVKKMIDIWVKRGFKVWNHWDNDHTPFLETIKTITVQVLGELVVGSWKAQNPDFRRPAVLRVHFRQRLPTTPRVCAFRPMCATIGS